MMQPRTPGRILFVREEARDFVPAECALDAWDRMTDEERAAWENLAAMELRKEKEG